MQTYAFGTLRDRSPAEIDKMQGESMLYSFSGDAAFYIGKAKLLREKPRNRTGPEPRKPAPNRCRKRFALFFPDQNLCNREDPASCQQLCCCGEGRSY